MTTPPPSLSALVNAQKPVTPPAAPVAPAAPAAPAGKSFWVGYTTGTVQKTEAEVRALAADPAFVTPIMAVGASVWSTVDAEGMRPVATPPAPAAPVVPDAPAAPTAPVAPVVTPAPVASAPAPAAPAAVTTSGPPSLRPSYPSPTVTTQSMSALPATISTPEAALAMRERLLARRDASMPSAASVVETIAHEGGGSHKHPFATLKEGNWTTSEFVEKAPGGTLVPNGNRDYHAIYIAHRVGATLWKGSGTAAKGAGQAPLGKFVLGTDNPSDHAHLTMIDRLTRYSRNVQMTGSDDKVVFDDIGRMTPEVQTLAWVTDGQWAGFVILVSPGYNAFAEQLAACRKAEVEELTFQTVSFHIELKQEKNAKAEKELAALRAAGAPPAELTKAEARCAWSSYYASLAKCTDGRAANLKARFDALMADETASMELMNQVVEFFNGADFGGGLNNEQILDLFEKYSHKPEPRRGGKR